MKYCYQCDKEVAELSGRGRCAVCEHLRSVANEQENEKLRRLAEALLTALDTEQPHALKHVAAGERLNLRAALAAGSQQHSGPRVRGRRDT